MVFKSRVASRYSGVALSKPLPKGGQIMKRFLTFFMLCGVLALASAPVHAEEYDRDDSDNPIRYVAYAMHPFGVALEYTITRPIHWLVHRPGLNYVFGAPRHEKAKVVEPITVIEQEPGSFIIEEGDSGLTENESALRDLMGNDLEIAVKEDTVEYTMVGDVFFEPGSAEITPEGQEKLRQVAASIRMDYPDNEIVIEGHTDDQPIEKSGWKSNWELGSARALAILHFMAESGFQPENLSAATYGQYRGRVENVTEEDRAKNRRAVITVKTKKELAMMVEGAEAVVIEEAPAEDVEEAPAEEETEGAAGPIDMSVPPAETDNTSGIE